MSFKLAILAVLDVILSVANNVSFWMVGNKMPDYSAFLSWSTMLPSPLIYFLAFQGCRAYRWYRRRADASGDLRRPFLTDEDRVDQDASAPNQLYDSTEAPPNEGPRPDSHEDPLVTRSVLTPSVLTPSVWHAPPTVGSWGLQLVFVLYALFLGMNQILSQYADPHTSGELQTLVSQVSLPFTGCVAFFLLKQRFGLWNLVGSAIVLGGSLLGALPPFLSRASGGGKVADSSVWLTVYVVSIFTLSAGFLTQQYAFTKFKVAPLVLLMWANLYSSVGVCVLVTLDMIPGFGQGLNATQLWENQTNGVVCVFKGFVTSSDLPDGCEANALPSFVVYSVSTALLILVQTLMIEGDSALFSVVANTLAIPATAFAFSWSWLLGSSAAQITWYDVASAFLITAGVVSYQMRSVVAGVADCRGKGGGPK